MPTPESVICILVVSAAAATATPASSLVGLVACTVVIASAGVATISFGAAAPAALLAWTGAAVLVLGDRPAPKAAGLLAIAGACLTLA